MCIVVGYVGDDRCYAFQEKPREKMSNIMTEPARQRFPLREKMRKCYGAVCSILIFLKNDVLYHRLLTRDNQMTVWDWSGESFRTWAGPFQGLPRCTWYGAPRKKCVLHAPCFKCYLTLIYVCMELRFGAIGMQKSINPLPNSLNLLQKMMIFGGNGNLAHSTTVHTCVS